MKDKLVGAWVLEDFQIFPKSGEPARPWGSDMSGTLIYEPSGYMSVAINRKPVESGSAQATLDSLLFYAGTFSIQDNCIRHQVTQASNPDRIGKEMLRFAEFDQTSMILTTPDEAFGKAKLVWRKVG